MPSRHALIYLLFLAVAGALALLDASRYVLRTQPRA
jgi:hypothetical protein